MYHKILISQKIKIITHDVYEKIPKKRGNYFFCKLKYDKSLYLKLIIAKYTDLKTTALLSTNDYETTLRVLVEETKDYELFTDLSKITNLLKWFIISNFIYVNKDVKNTTKKFVLIENNNIVYKRAILFENKEKDFYVNKKVPIHFSDSEFFIVGSTLTIDEYDKILTPTNVSNLKIKQKYIKMYVNNINYISSKDNQFKKIKIENLY